MADLTPEQRAFLAAHGVADHVIFDASGMSRSKYQKLMEQEGKYFACGVSRCRRGHHSLRTRQGHCIQCNHAAIAFAQRNDAPAYVYISGSRRAELIKIGLTTSLHDRRRNIATEGWAGCTDWQMLAFAASDHAGRVEREVHARLSRWRTSCEYVQGGTRHHSYEVFRCNFADALDALNSALPHGCEVKMLDETGLSEFNFRRS